MREARANRKSPVRIATVLSQRELADGWPAPDRRLVHHVVVEQRGQVGQLDRDRSRHEPAVPRIAELRGEQHEHRAEALAARVDQVQGGLGEQGLLGARRLPDDGLDAA